jgi:alanyl-tRNA synthetase
VGLLDQTVQIDDVAVLAVQIDAPDIDTMRQMTDWLRDRLGSSVVVVGAVLNEKPQMVAAVTQDLTKRGMNAGQMIRDIAKIVGGGGGGGPKMAQAGGKNSDKLPDALRSVARWVEENLK